MQARRKRVLQSHIITWDYLFIFFFFFLPFLKVCKTLTYFFHVYAWDISIKNIVICGISVYGIWEDQSKKSLALSLSQKTIYFWLYSNKNTHCITLGKSTMWSESNGQLCYASYLCHMTQTEILYRTLHTNPNFAQLTSQENRLYSHCES
jgi:hypothetical protein